jgi:signal transduction histidine kinase/CheY-like chemotaxis protein
MCRFARWFGLIAAVAGAHFLSGWLGGLLALPPGPTLTVWPAAGVALAAMLWFGYRIWLGVWLGAFLLWLCLAEEMGDPVAPGGWLAGTVAFGPVLQALAGAWLIRRLVGHPASLLRQRDIWLFVLAAGPVPALIGTTWQGTWRCLAGVPWAEFGHVWLYTWLANAFGGVLILTLLLPLGGQPREVWRPRLLSVSLPMLVLTALGTYILLIARAWDQEQITKVLDAEAKLGVRNLEKWAGNGEIGLGEWRNQVASHFAPGDATILERASVPLLKYHDTLRGIGVLRVVGRDERHDFETTYPVRDQSQDGDFAAAPVRDRYVCLTALYPLSASPAVYGWDLGSDERCRAALQRACDDNEPSAADHVSLLPDSTAENSLVVFLPVYDITPSPDNLKARRKHLRGYAVSAFNMDEIIRHATVRQRGEGIHLTWKLSPNNVKPSLSLRWVPSGVEQTSLATLAGRHCELRFLGSTEEFLHARQTRHVWLIAVLGCAFNVLLGALLLTASGRTALVEGEVRQRTAELTREVEEHRRTEEALRRAKEAAEAANQAKTDFLSNVSHELRTPLNGILGMTELLLDEVRNETQREHLRIVKRSGEGLLSIITDLLDFSRIEAGRIELHPQPFDLHQEIGDTLKALAERARGKGLELVCALAPDVPDAVVGDAGRFRQVLVNLVGNAIKFTEAGGIVVRLSREASDSGLRLACSVTDTGIGIPAGKLCTIFEPFEQADRSTTRRYGGTGLGLTISTRLVALMGGRIAVESELGEGSVFRFSVRFLEVASDGKIEPEVPAGRSALVAGVGPLSRPVLEEVLHGWDIRTTWADDTDTALEMCRSSGPFDVLLIDPDGLGGAREFLHRLPGVIADVPPILRLGSLGTSDEQRPAPTSLVIVDLAKPALPRELRRALAKAWQPPAAVPPAPSESPVTERPSLRVLVAEDNPTNQKLLSIMLQREGHSVQLADDGRAVLAALENGDFDLVLMDVQMPQMDGWQTTAEIRRRWGTERDHLPIVALTAMAASVDREKCLQAGMDDYLRKPIQTAELTRVLAWVAQSKGKFAQAHR